MQFIRTAHSIAAANPIGAASGPILQVHEWSGSGPVESLYTEPSAPYLAAEHLHYTDSISIDLGSVNGLVVVMASITLMQPLPLDSPNGVTHFKYDFSNPDPTYPTNYQTTPAGLTISDGTTSVLVDADGIGTNESAGTEPGQSADPTQMTDSWMVSYRGMRALAATNAAMTITCSFDVFCLTSAGLSATLFTTDAEWWGSVGIFTGGS